MTKRTQLLKKAQKVFNEFIRARDKENGCISCGGPVNHAGHYMNQRQHSALRFDEYNVNGQCVKCNCFLHGNIVRYRQGLVRKYGEDVVDRLEETVVLKKWSVSELEEIINKYKNHV